MLNRMKKWRWLQQSKDVTLRSFKTIVQDLGGQVQHQYHGPQYNLTLQYIVQFINME